MVNPHCPDCYTRFNCSIFNITLKKVGTILTVKNSAGMQKSQFGMISLLRKLPCITTLACESMSFIGFSDWTGRVFIIRPERLEHVLHVKPFMVLADSKGKRIG